jgi:serine/threonine protein kinase
VCYFTPVQVVDAVAYLHSLGILHRDIKPENCLLAKPASHYTSKNKPIKVGTHAAHVFPAPRQLPSMLR